MMHLSYIIGLCFFGILPSGEIIARLLLQPDLFLPPSLNHEPYTRQLVFHDKAGCRSPSVFSTNLLGLRGDDPPSPWVGSKSLIALGNSTTICYFNHDSLTWPAKLQSLTGVWVGNAGVDGVSLKGQELMFHEILKRFRPSAFVLFAGVPDLSSSIKESYRQVGFPHDNVLSNRLAHLAFVDRILESSVLARFIHRRYRLSKPIQEIRKPPMAQFALPEGRDSPDLDTTFMAQTLKDYESRLTSMVSEAQGLGIRMILLTQPSLFRDTDFWRNRTRLSVEWQKKRFSLSAAMEWRLLQKFNEATIRMSEFGNVTVIDVARMIPPDPTLFIDGYHFTDKGCEVMAHLVAKGMGPI